MQLTMTVLRCPDSVAPETRNVAGGEFSVGRGPGVDWVLPDPERLLSKRHFAVAFRGGVWQLADTSTNGTFLNREGDPIGAGDVRSLRDGDRLRLGAYEIEVRLVEEAWRARPRVGRQPVRRSVRHGSVRPARPERNPFDEPDHPSLRIGPDVGAVAARLRSDGAGAARDAVPRSDPGGQFAGRCRMRSSLAAARSARCRCIPAA